MLESEGVSEVRAFVVPAGMWPDGSGPDQWAALVKWRSTSIDMLHQVYLDGKLAGWTSAFDQRSIMVALGTSARWPVTVEVYAVEPENCQRDLWAAQFGQFKRGNRVSIKLPRCQQFGHEAEMFIYGDGGSGTIDYSAPLVGPIQVWQSWLDKAGFGMSSFGHEEFGHELVTGIGFGLGLFGEAQFGHDSGVIEWLSDEMKSGNYLFEVRVAECDGSKVYSSQLGPVAIVGLPEPARSLNLSSSIVGGNVVVFDIN